MDRTHVTTDDEIRFAVTDLLNTLVVRENLDAEQAATRLRDLVDQVVSQQVAAGRWASDR